MHFYETPSAIRFVLFTDSEMDPANGQQILLKVYSMYVEYASKGNQGIENSDLLKYIKTLV